MAKSKLTPQLQAEFCKALENGASILGACGHVAIEGSVEHANVLYVGNKLLASFETLDGRRAIEGVDANDGVKIFLLFFTKNSGSLELFAAVSEAVANCTDFGYVGKHTEFGINEQFEHEGNCIVVAAKRNLCFVVFFAWALVSYGTVDTDTVAKAFGDHLTACHIKYLILK